MYNMNHNKEKGITTMKKKNLIMIATGTVFFLSTMFAKEMSLIDDVFALQKVLPIHLDELTMRLCKEYDQLGPFQSI